MAEWKTADNPQKTRNGFEYIAEANLDESTTISIYARMSYRNDRLFDFGITFDRCRSENVFTDSLFEYLEKMGAPEVVDLIKGKPLDGNTSLGAIVREYAYSKLVETRKKERELLEFMDVGTIMSNSTYPGFPSGHPCFSPRMENTSAEQGERAKVKTLRPC